MHPRSTIVGFAALTVLLTAGAAQSLTGTSTVDSGDIIDATITHADVKANSLGGSRFMDNSVTSGKILNNTIRSADLAANSIDGSKVSDRQMDPMSGGTVGGIDPGDYSPTHGSVAVNLDSVGAGACVNQFVFVTGGIPNTSGLVATPSGNFETTSDNFVVTTYEGSTTGDGFFVRACNLGAMAINPPEWRFNYLFLY